jgi:hypothetical protein
MLASFQPHGEFTVRLDGRIIVSEVLGPWNREAVLNWVREVHVLAKMLATTGPHVGLAVVRGSLLCPPDALEAMREALTYATSKLQCVGNGIVADASVEGRDLLLGTYARIYEDSAPHRFFHEYDSAKLWALQLLAQRGCY